MLARLARELPAGHRYDPKWDGFRCLAFRAGADVDLRSRNDRPLSRYFPEIVEALRELGEPAVVLDGELLVRVGGRFDFDALLRRIHPAATQVARMADAAPAVLVVFDLLAVGADDLRALPFAERRARLEQLFEGGHPASVLLSPSTDDVATARRWLDATDGIDGVVAKDPASRYEPGKRVMVKVKRERTADCVVAGCRLTGASPPGVSSLLLGLYDGRTLRHVGVAASFDRRMRHELLGVLGPYVTDLAGHPWEHGFALEGGSMGRLPGSAGRWQPGLPLDWVPLRPELVCEVRYDRVDRGRWRHPGRFLRWRPDRDAASCTVDQLELGAA